MIHKNPKTPFCRSEYSPEVDVSAFGNPLAAVIGHVIIGRKVFVAPFASVRGDEGHPRRCGARVHHHGQADSLPKMTEAYPIKSLNQAAVRVNAGLAAGYKSTGLASGAEGADLANKHR